MKLTWLSDRVASTAYNCVGYDFQTLPWLSLSPLKIKRLNRIVSTSLRICRTHTCRYLHHHRPRWYLLFHYCNWNCPSTYPRCYQHTLGAISKCSIAQADSERHSGVWRKSITTSAVALGPWTGMMMWSLPETPFSFLIFWSFSAILLI